MQEQIKKFLIPLNHKSAWFFFCLIFLSIRLKPAACSESKKLHFFVSFIRQKSSNLYRICYSRVIGGEGIQTSYRNFHIRELFFTIWMLPWLHTLNIPILYGGCKMVHIFEYIEILGIQPFNPLHENKVSSVS